MKKISIIAADETKFFARGRLLAALADAGKPILSESVISFGDPADLLKMLTPACAALMQATAVHQNFGHSFSKTTVPKIELVVGHGVRGDAHFGVTVKHRSRVAKDPSQPNFRQVHLLQEELLVALAAGGFNVSAGDMGENLTTRGIDLLALATGTRLMIGLSAVIEITGLRNPCSQIENFQSGLLAAVLDRDVNGALVRKTGVMAVVLQGGFIYAGDAIHIVHEPHEYKMLMPV